MDTSELYIMQRSMPTPDMSAVRWKSVLRDGCLWMSWGSLGTSMPLSLPKLFPPCQYDILFIQGHSVCRHSCCKDHPIRKRSWHADCNGAPGKGHFPSARNAIAMSREHCTLHFDLPPMIPVYLTQVDHWARSMQAFALGLHSAPAARNCTLSSTICCMHDRRGVQTLSHVSYIQ